MKCRYYHRLSENSRISGWLKYRLWLLEITQKNLYINSLYHRIWFNTIWNSDAFRITNIPCMCDDPILNSLYFHYLQAYESLTPILWCFDDLIVYCVRARSVVKTLNQTREYSNFPLQLIPVFHVFLRVVVYFLPVHGIMNRYLVCQFL